MHDRLKSQSAMEPSASFATVLCRSAVIAAPNVRVLANWLAHHPDTTALLLLPERPVHLVRQRLHDIGQDVALAGLDVDLRRHAGLQAPGVLEAGLPVVERGPATK